MVQILKPGGRLNPDDNLALYLRDMGKHRPLMQEEETELIFRSKKGDRHALDTLVRAHLRFVVSVCLRYRNRGVPLGDLINEGNLGLLKAVDRFEPAQGVKFLSYAVWWIRQGVLSALARQNGILSLPPNWMNDRAKIRTADRVLRQRLGRAPTAEELGAETGYSPSSAGALARPLPSQVEALASDETGEGDPLDHVATEGAMGSPDAESRRRFLHEHTEAALTSLPPRERDVLRCFYGIGSGGSLTLEEIGRGLGLSKERIRQIKASGLARLRQPIRQTELEAARSWVG